MLFSQPFFLVGIAAVAWLFLGGSLAGFSMFLPDGPHRGLLRWLSASLVALLLLLGWACQQTWPGIQEVIDGAELGRNDIFERRKEALSLLMLGVSAVFNALMTAFSWVRAGFAGNALRSAVWAIVGIRVVAGSVTLLGLLGRAAGDGAEPIPDAELGAAFADTMTPVRDGLQSFAIGGLVVVAVSAAVSLGLALRGRRAAPVA